MRTTGYCHATAVTHTHTHTLLHFYTFISVHLGRNEIFPPHSKEGHQLQATVHGEGPERLQLR